MKLFFREQLPIIFVYCLQLLIILVIFWLDGYQKVSISLYAAFLSLCLFTGYLVYRYLTHRSFYQRLDKPFDQQDSFMSNGSKPPLAVGLQLLLQDQYRLFQSELNHSQHKLKEHIQFINQWVHQMKTPVSVIHLMIQEEDEPRFNGIGDELDRLKKGLDLVLYTARLEEFGHDFYVETLRLDKLVRTVTSNQKRLFIRNRVFPFIQIDENLMIATDEKWLSFALTQIITNAVRYTVEENRKVYFKGYRHASDILLEIQDEGVGIAKSDLPRVFEPYYTGENGRNFQESTGMGLHLVKQICNQLGHRVEIESKENQGTTVRFIF
jgi:two-component system, OmpR family, sensor histidine kinase YxdK